ncbi:DUF262 domain-containing protein [Kaistia geumhonensis]|uniref:Uncharacterized protein with ParB-like and HNH nuclease domain n=1 Tax=Kaistia geumhonensis TaxID=410839 RepID=A0ABU0M3N8_9HYPH|nr:DUF262 domain-containing protein [Kaistia geumhonensis]MCX5479207.1 DUF262 domain-containing protein [Kaistia geumhonensis]MDQ0515573.1 uncharacterized protein with ParB-like and HNH nuclease domain [Kaistia geumhonensis]
MEASPAQVIQYFNGEKQNLIPLFQRPYSWRLPNWKTLWDDMLVQYDADEKSAHFMGTIVSVPARSVPVGVSKYLIIDGQQRLTTVSILLAALRDTLDKNSSDRIQEVYLTNRFREPEDTLKFVPTQIDRDRYRAIILDRVVPDDQSLMSEAYAYFKNQLLRGLDPNGDAIDRAKVLTTVERALQVVMINLGDDDDPYLIFESLNFKGEPLTQADLVRNYILMRFRHSMSTGGDQERIYTKYWAPMEQRLGDNITEFLRHYAMKGGDNVYQRGIYAATKALLKGMQEPADVEAELGRMTNFSVIYASILDPSLEQTPSIRKRLMNLRSLDVGTSYPLLLRLFEARNAGTISSEDLEKCLDLVESFVVRRAVCVVPTNALNKLFLQWARQFPRENHVSWLHVAMSTGAGGRRFPNDAEFGENFKNFAQYGRGYTRYVLLRLEEAFGHRERVDLTNATIEHIMPQTMTAEWENEIGLHADSVHARLKDTFGNLSLTAYNTELGNLPFREKKAKLANTHIELNRFVLDRAQWDETAIKHRAETLFSKAEALWRGPIESTAAATPMPEAKAE